MNYHIVKANDTIEKIIKFYNVTLEEVKSINKHITNWDKMIPGTKIKMPEISDAICDEIDCVEPFIEEYYPKIDIEKYQDNDNINSNLQNDYVEESVPVTKSIEIPKKNKQSKIVYPGYYYPYMNYYYPRKRKNSR